MSAQVLDSLRQLPELLTSNERWNLLNPMLVNASRLNLSRKTIKLTILENDLLDGVRSVMDLQERDQLHVQFFGRRGDPLRGIRFHGLEVVDARFDLDHEVDSPVAPRKHEIDLVYRVLQLT